MQLAVVTLGFWFDFYARIRPGLFRFFKHCWSHVNKLPEEIGVGDFLSEFYCVNCLADLGPKVFISGIATDYSFVLFYHP